MANLGSECRDMSSNILVTVMCDGTTAMASAEEFLLAIGANIRRRKRRTILADVVHPDGFDCSVSIKYCVSQDEEGDNNVLQVRRRAGDAVLFYVVSKGITDWDCGKGKSPRKFYDGQICPRVLVRPSPQPLMDIPPMPMGGVKRKAEYVDTGSESST